LGEEPKIIISLIFCRHNGNNVDDNLESLIFFKKWTIFTFMAVKKDIQ
jgi:hypothetical protein